MSRREVVATWGEVGKCIGLGVLPFLGALVLVLGGCALATCASGCGGDAFGTGPELVDGQADADGGDGAPAIDAGSSPDVEGDASADETSIRADAEPSRDAQDETRATSADAAADVDARALPPPVDASADAPDALAPPPPDAGRTCCALQSGNAVLACGPNDWSCNGQPCAGGTCQAGGVCFFGTTQGRIYACP